MFHNLILINVMTGFRTKFLMLIDEYRIGQDMFHNDTDSDADTYTDDIDLDIHNDTDADADTDTDTASEIHNS